MSEPIHLIYQSVSAEGSPEIALKTKSVDEKIRHIKVRSFIINADYGYALYKAQVFAEGVIKGDKILWNLREKLSDN